MKLKIKPHGGVRVSFTFHNIHSFLRFERNFCFELFHLSFVKFSNEEDTASELNTKRVKRTVLKRC